MEIINLLNKASRANYDDQFREGNLIRLPSDCSVVVTGDIHGHRRNFEKITAFANLENKPDRHMVLQEIIHGGPQDSQGGCLSYKLLLEAVRYKIKFPDRVHIIMGNHDTAFISDSEVIKDGRKMNRSFRQALKTEFGKNSSKVETAMKKLLFSQPLAVRCNNRIWLSHSLPNQRCVDNFDPTVMNRDLKLEDCQRFASVYYLTWGRNHSQKLLDKMAQLFDVDIFILGHQAQEQGSCKAGKNLIIIASDHEHGCLLPVNLRKSYTIEELIDSIVPLASIV